MSITWKRAAKLCGADTKELKDWPERLSIEQAAILAAGNRAADFTTALEAMHEATEQGSLPAEDAERPREVRMLLREPDRFEVLAAGPCKTVAAGDVLAWLDEQGQDPGEHVRAWDDCIQDRRGRELARAAVSHMGLFQPVETPPAVTMAEAARKGIAEAVSSHLLKPPAVPAFAHYLVERDALLPTGRDIPLPESMTEEGQRKRRIELAEEEERARLRVRDEWERERRGAAPAEAPPVQSTTPAPATAAAPLSRQKHQELEILRTLRELGYDPMRLPRRPAGTPTAKAEARAKLPKLTPKMFDKAWERLRGYGEIAEVE